MADAPNYLINEPFYKWSVRAFSILHKRIGMKISVHAEPNVMQDGQIFLFNHFARFETIVPQYFIYKATGAYCRCVATHELFESSERFARVLWGVGAVPSNHPGLLAFLAAEILRGQKVIFFPEGSMMKDRSIAAPPHEGVFDAFKTRTGHKQGAAALAVILELYKQRILSVADAGDVDRLDRWVAALGLENREALIAAARKPTLVVPSNITFHPIHRGENVLLKAADFLKFNLGQNGRDELMVEGNLLLRKTDMDIRFGRPINPDISWNRADRMLLARAFEQIDSLDDLFGLKDKAERWTDTLAAGTVQRATRRLRDRCMVEMYANVTLNISHLAARILIQLAEQGQTIVGRTNFHSTLYAVIKAVQRENGLHLHRSITDPNIYGTLPNKACDALEVFYATSAEAGLITVDDTNIHLRPSLLGQTFDSDPRLANMIRVYANEVESLTQVRLVIENAKPLSGRALAETLFDDEQHLHAIDFEAAPSDAELHEPDKKDSRPFLLLPEIASKVGVVLVHGFLASPAEVKSFGEKLCAAGHPVMGVRLKGHGTAPHDLQTRSHDEWMDSVRRGFEIMSHLSPEVAIVGFATGASLALLLAAERPKPLIFVASVSAPITFRIHSLRYAPLLHRINQLSQWAYMQNGVKPFQAGEPEHPDIEYRNMPVRALMELRKVVDLLEQKLGNVQCPVMIIQGSGDPVVNPASARLIAEQIGSLVKSVHVVQSNRHGILHENIGDIQNLIMAKLAQFSAPQSLPTPLRKGLLPRITAKIAGLLSGRADRRDRVEPE